MCLCLVMAAISVGREWSRQFEEVPARDWNDHTDSTIDSRVLQKGARLWHSAQGGPDHTIEGSLWLIWFCHTNGLSH